MGATHKTLLIHVERAQISILKVMLFKKRDYPTVQLYSELRLLTVRHIYILRTILRQHSSLPLDDFIVQYRRGHLVSRIVPCRTSFARRQAAAQGTSLYNNVKNWSPVTHSLSITSKIRYTIMLQPIGCKILYTTILRISSQFFFWNMILFIILSIIWFSFIFL